MSLWARIRVPISASPARLQTRRWENQSPSLEATENLFASLKRFFYSKAAVASPSHAWWDFICQKKKKIRLLLSPCEIQPRETYG